MSDYVPSRNDGVPVPTKRVVYRPVEHRPGPFGDLSKTVTGHVKYDSEQQRLKAQASGRKRLKTLDTRRGANRKPQVRKPYDGTKDLRRPSAAILPDDKLREYAAQGLTASEIARAVGNISSRTVRIRAGVLGVDLRNGHPGKIADRCDLAELDRLHNSGMTWLAIADQFHVNRESLRKVMREYHQRQRGDAA